MRTGIVVVNYNDWKTTSRFLDIVDAFSCVDKIVVVDNHSTDGSSHHLQAKRSEKIELIAVDENGGYAKGNNVGARYLVEECGVECVIISNPDIELSERSLLKIIDCLWDDCDAALATGVVHNYVNGEEKVFSGFAWKVPTYGDMLSNCFLTIYKLRRSLLKKSQYYDYSILNQDAVVNVECVSGCFFAIKSDVLKSIGYFDERTFLYHEEDILGYEIKDLGKKSIICTDAAVYHKENPEKAKGFRKRITVERITLASALVYLRHYLRCGTIRIAFYSGMYWVGRMENTLVKRLRVVWRRLWKTR